MYFFRILLLYFSFLPVSYSFDGTVFSHFLRYALEKHNLLDVVQIHHIFYFPANYLIYRVLEAIFNYQAFEFFHLQLFSMFFGVMTLALLGMAFKRTDTSEIKTFKWAMLLFIFAATIIGNSQKYQNETNFWASALTSYQNDSFFLSKYAGQLREDGDFIRSEILLRQALSFKINNSTTVFIALQLADITFTRERYEESLAGWKR